jgi:hypothetical protein
MAVGAPRRGAVAAACLLLATVATAGGGAAAWAAPKPRVALLRFEFQGRVPEVSQVWLTERLVEGMGIAGFEVSAGEVLKSALETGPALESCRDERCYRLIAGRLALDYLVIATLKIAERNYEMKVNLVAGRDGRVAGEETGRCELCGIQEVGAKLITMGQALRTYVDAGRPAPARLTVQSQPSGASVTIDGRAAGETPLSIELPPGAHDLALSASGHAASRKKISLAAGVSEILSIDLLPLYGAPGPVPRFIPWQPIGWAAVVVGVATAAAGGVVLYFDGTKVECPAPMPMGECTRNMKILAGALFGAGGTAVAMGGLLLILTADPSGPSTAEAVAGRSWVLSARKTF